MGTRQEMASSGPDFLRDSGPLPLQLLTGFKLKHGRLTVLNVHQPDFDECIRSDSQFFSAPGAMHDFASWSPVTG
jgi:hypothetical protein